MKSLRHPEFRDYRMKEDWQALESVLGHRFEERALLEEAMSHRSYAEENRPLRSYDRLEFLGDAVLSLVIAEGAIEHLPEKNEGHLSKLRSSLVERRSLSRKAKSIGLGAYLRLGRGEEAQGGRGKEKILEDAFEAIIGAVYQDAGFEAARDVVKALFAEELSALVRGDFELSINAKGVFQEYCQKAGGDTPKYLDGERTGPEHLTIFEAFAMWNGEKVGEGKGSSKKEAEQNAARDAIKRLGILP